MEELSRNPVHGAVWRELNCCITLGVKWQLIWTLVISFLPKSHANIYKFITILCLSWRSVTRYEMTSGWPYSLPNAVQRFSVSMLLLLLVSNVLGYVPLPDGTTYQPLKGLPLESELTTFFICFLLFLSIRTVWNFGILVNEGWIAMCDFITTTEIDPVSGWDRVGHAILESSSKFKLTFRRITDANGAHINWILFSAMDAACREIDCLLVMGLTSSIVFIIGSSCLQFMLGLSFHFLLIFYCMGTLMAFKNFYVAFVSCNTRLRLVVRFSINLGLLAILVLVIPRHAEKSPGLTSFGAFVAMRLVHLSMVVWDLAGCRGWCWWTWSPQAQSKLSLVPLVLWFVLLKLCRKSKTFVLGVIQYRKVKKGLHEAGNRDWTKYKSSTIKRRDLFPEKEVEKEEQIFCKTTSPMFKKS